MSETHSDNGAEVPAILDPEHAERLERLFSGINHAKKRKWLAAVAVSGRLREAERMTGIQMRFHYMWKEKDPNYLAAFEEAKSIACDMAEDSIWERAFSGIDRPLSFKGKLTGDKIREYSDLLAMFMLKGERPAKYREDSRVQINVNVPPAVNILPPAIDVTPESQDNPTCDAEKVLKL